MSAMDAPEKPLRLVIDKPGGSESIRAEPLAALPDPAPGEVLVEHLVAGLGMTDLSVIAGQYFRKFPFPLVPGYDFIGRVLSTNGECATADGDALSAGDLVACMPSHGALQTHSVRRAADLVRLPPRAGALDPAAAVSLVLNYTTAYYGLHRSGADLERRAAAARAEGRDAVVLVQAAAGGLGTALLDLLRAVPGVKVYGTCSAGKRGVVEALGAEAIDYKTQDFVEVIKQKTAGRGADVVFDSNGGQVALRSSYALSPDGRLILFGFTSDRSASGLFAVARALVGTTLAFWTSQSAYFCGIVLRREADVAEWNRTVKELVEMLHAGKLQPVVEGYVELEDAPAALQYIARGLVTGKIAVAIEKSVVERAKTSRRLFTEEDIRKKLA